MKPLNPFKISLSGVNLIEASAGTGKTYNIASLYVRTVVDEQKTTDQILVVTYTEAATKELRDRLMKRLQEAVQALEGKEFAHDDFLQQLPRHVQDRQAGIARLKEAIRSFDEAAVFTIHGFCRRVLQNRAFESRTLFDAELIGDDSEIIRELVDDYWRNWVENASDNPLQRPLLKLLLDKGYSPEKLSDELASFTAKPYLQLKPDKLKAVQEFSATLQQLSDLYEELAEIWETDQEHILDLLKGEAMNGNKYPQKSVDTWGRDMDEWLQGDVVPLKPFDRFDKFTQSTIAESLKKDRQAPSHPFFERTDLYNSLAESVQDFDVHFKGHLYRHLQQRADARKEALQVFSFDDLLIKLQNALTHPGRGKRLKKTLRASYPIALVDEFQDTDPVQYRIFKEIYAGADNTALFMIGDSKQSIYGFRGADIFTYLQAKHDAPDKNVFSLDRNFRSVPPLIAGINALFGYSPNPFILEDIPFHPVKPGKERYDRLTIEGTAATPILIPRLQESGDDHPIKKGVAEQRSARDTAMRIYRLLAQGRAGKALIGSEKLKAGDIAVLVRSHHQASAISSALQDRSIKSVEYSRESVFISDETEQLHYVLKAIAEPANEGRIKAALATEFMGYTADDLLRLEHEEEQWAQKLQQFAGWHSTWQHLGSAAALQQMMHDENTAARIIRLENGERKLTNYIHLSELLQQEEQNGKTAARSLLRWFAAKRSEGQKEQEEEQLRLESDENLVKVVTMHRSKGLEYPVVFCPFLWKGPKLSDEGKPLVYHGPDNETAWLDLNGKSDPERDRKRFIVAKENLAESIRLAYVAITRAKHQCILPWVHADKSEYSPLGALLLGNKQSLEVLNKTIETGSSYEAVDAAVFDRHLSDLVEQHAGLFAFADDTPGEQQQLNMDTDDSASLQARSFNGKTELSAGQAISSFSSLSRREHAGDELYKPLYFDEPLKAEQTEKHNQPRNNFTFPRGPNPGTAIHHIFEEIDFSDATGRDAVIRRTLAKQSIGEQWVPAARRMAEDTLEKELLAGEPGLKLNNIARHERIAELEFYFRSDQVQLQQLLRIIRPESNKAVAADGFADKGYLKGFIDLTFSFNGRFYILDYKTNHLGDETEDYRREKLNDEMYQALYDLQYHLYCVALHRYLGNRMTNYSYDNHFGGAFYLFLRGINPDGDEGIYFDRPDESLITALNNYIGRGEL